jgi:hypothetical protein
MEDLPFMIGGTIHGLVETDLTETFTRDGVEISIKGSQVQARYGNQDERDVAEELMESYVDAWAFDHDTRLKIVFHSSSERKPDGTTTHTRQAAASVLLSSRLQTVTTRADGTQEQYDSASFVNEDGLVSQARSNEVLRKALRHYNEEVADNEKPLYGIYKALEVIADALGGRAKLAALVGETKSYVDAVMETTQTERHSTTRARALLPDDECRGRARRLIQAYAERP